MKLKNILIAYIIASAVAYACTPQREAEDAYTAEHLACIEHAKTKAQADACRDKVRAEWHQLDAGGDQ